MQKSEKNFIVDARLGSKNVSDIAFNVEKVYRSRYLSDIVKVEFRNLSFASFRVLVSPINKTLSGLTKKV